jgi:hypothetical protein
MIRAREYLLIGSTCLSGILSGVLLLGRLFGVLKGTVIEYFGLEIFAPGCLLRIECILNFLVGFLIRTKRIVSLRRCFYNATSEEGVEYRPFTGRPRFFRELLIAVS